MIDQALDMVTLGKSDLRVTALGIGTWQWGDQLVWGYWRGYNEADLQPAFQAALDQGINFFDTAELYGFGRSEKLLGGFKQNIPQTLVIATKFFPLPWRFTKSQFLASLRGSLKRLRMKQVDLYQIHWPSAPGSIELWMDAMTDAVTQGLTRTIGVSNYTLDQTRRAVAALRKRGMVLTSNQMEYSLLDRDVEKNGLLSYCRDEGITLIAYSPLGKGMLTGKYTPDNPPKGARSRWYTPQYLTAIQPLVAMLRQMGEAHGSKTPSQVAINWLICKSTIPIPGVKNTRQVEDNVGSLGWRLTASEVTALEGAADALPAR